MNTRDGVIVLALVIATSGCNLFTSSNGETSNNSDPMPDGSVADSGNQDTSNAPDAPATPDTSAGMDAGMDAEQPTDMMSGDPDMGMDADVTPPQDFGPVGDLGWAPESGRVTDNLLLFYTFEANAGTDVIDRSTRGNSPSLVLGPTATWLAGRNGVQVDGPGRITSAGAGVDLYDWVVPREEITVEVWVKPDNLTQDGPARIVTFSQNGSTRNFTIGQEAGDYVVRFSVNDSEYDDNGRPSVDAVGAVALAETQITITYNGLFTRLYVNGIELGTSLRTGGLQHWDRQMAFLLGNENGTERQWAGEIYMLAVYDRALSTNEILRNFVEGSTVPAP